MTINTKYLALLAAVLLLPATAFAQESTAIFQIHKIWNQGGDHSQHQVTGHLSCTGANTTQTNVVFTATTDALLYVYDLVVAPGPVDCTVTETVPDNYTAEYECSVGNCGDSEQDVDACFFPDVDQEPDAIYLCNITNTPDPAEITVTKTWVIEGGDQGFNGQHEIWASCDSDVEVEDYCDGSAFDGYAEVCVDSAVEGSHDYVFTITQPNYPETVCEVSESTYDSVIESDNGCGDEQNDVEVSAGDEESCEIVNTVFFEGIPTLSQYGMAILALLMLGVGFVGFRRFV